MSKTAPEYFKIRIEDIALLDESLDTIEYMKVVTKIVNSALEETGHEVKNKVEAESALGKHEAKRIGNRIRDNLSNYQEFRNKQSKRGKKGGAPKSNKNAHRIDQGTIAVILEMHNQGMSNQRIAAEVGVAKSTVQKYVSQAVETVNSTDTSTDTSTDAKPVISTVPGGRDKAVDEAVATGPSTGISTGLKSSDCKGSDRSRQANNNNYNNNNNNYYYRDCTDNSNSASPTCGGGEATDLSDCDDSTTSSASGRKDDFDVDKIVDDILANNWLS